MGGGPSGCEVAWRCARSGLDTLLATTSMDTLYNLIGDGWRLNPAEGTLMAHLHAAEADEDGYVTTWSFHRAAKQALEATPMLHVLQSNVSALRVEDGRVVGLATWEGVDRWAERVVLAAGTFLGARLEIGSVTETAGKLSEMAYDDLFESLRERGFRFRPVELEAEGGEGALPYRVRCHAFDPDELEGFRLSRLEGLYAVGACARGAIAFEEAAADGLALGEELTRARGRS